MAREIPHLPLPSHTPIKSFQHFNSTPLLLKIGWTRAVPPQRKRGQGYGRGGITEQSWLCSHCSWAASPIPIKNLHFPQNSEQLSPQNEQMLKHCCQKKPELLPSETDCATWTIQRNWDTRRRSIRSKHTFAPDLLVLNFAFICYFNWAPLAPLNYFSQQVNESSNIRIVILLLIVL